MSGLRLIGNGLAALVLALALAWLFGHIPFTPAGTTLLIRAAGLFGITGDEGIETFYMVATLLLSLVLAIVIVLSIDRRYRRRSDGGTASRR